MLTWLMENTLVAGSLAVLALAVCGRLKRWPALCHVIWVLVLVRLVMPPVVGAGGWWPFEVRREAEAMGRRAISGLMQSAMLEKYPLPGGEQGAHDWVGYVAAGAYANSTDARRATYSANPNFMVGPSEPAAVSSASEDVRVTSPEPMSSPIDEVVPFDVAYPAIGPAAPGSAGESRRAQGEVFSVIVGTVRANLTVILLAIWAVGAVGAILAVAIGWGRVLRLVRGSELADHAAENLLKEFAAKIGVKPPALRVSDAVVSPVVVGVLRPTLLWPADRRELDESLVLHELAHLRRRDPLFGVLDLIARIVMWWNPVYWIVSRQASKYAELACDAWVVALLPSARRRYAESLITCAERVSVLGGRSLALSASASGRRAFEGRLRGIISGTMAHGAPRLAVLLLTVGLVALAPMRRENGWTAPTGEEFGQIESHVRAIQVARQTRLLAASGEFDEAARTAMSLGPEYPLEARRALTLALSSGEARLIREAALAVLAQSPYDADAIMALAHHSGGPSSSGLYDVALGCGFVAEDESSIWVTTPSRNGDERPPAIRDAKARADDAFSVGDWERAERELDTLTSLAPQCGQAWFRRGYCLLSLDRPGDAVACLERANELGFRVPAARHNLACAHARLGDAETSGRWALASVEAGFKRVELLRDEPSYDHLLGIPEVARAIADRDECLTGINRVGQRIVQRDWRAVVREGVEVAESVMILPDERAGLLRQVRAAAIESDDRVLVARASHACARWGVELEYSLLSMAESASESGDRESAVRLLRLALDAGFVDLRRLQQSESLKDLHADERFQQIAFQCVESAILARENAVSWTHLRKKIEAKRALGAIKAGEYNLLGWAYLRLQKYDAALGAFQAQIDLFGPMPVLYYNMACAHSLAGRHDRAMHYLDMYARSPNFDPDLMASDPDLAALRRDPRFQELVKLPSAARERYSTMVGIASPEPDSPVRVKDTRG